jgi:hypothetical protein
MIRVQPARDRRIAFARWAIEQDPMVRTCSHVEFAVPPDLFTHMPEDLLVGSLVDGHRYRSPLEDSEQPESEAVPGEPQPPVPDSAYPPGDVPLDEQPEESAVRCDLCERTFSTERGRDTHRRQVHPEEAP